MTPYDSPRFSHEPAAAPGSSATARVIEELQLYGYHPHDDEPDPRPLPDGPSLEGALDGLFQILSETLADTRLEPDLPDLLWHLADLFHRKADRVQRQLDDNEQKQRASQKDQDGSEVRSVELERCINQGLTILERRNVFEMMRDNAAQHYESQTGHAWRPRAGSLVNRKLKTAALIDSRDFLAAKTKAETEVMFPPGPRIAFSGGIECADTTRIWAVLDKALARYPGMILMHGGAPRGADKIAALWADQRKVTQIAFLPDFKRDGKASVFKRNDRMLEADPVHLIAFPGSGITDNIVDKAKKQRVPIADFRQKAAAKK